MNKKKISKYGLLSYLDGELDDNSSQLVKEYLLDNEEDTRFLESIVKVENSFSDDKDFKMSQEAQDKIFSNANAFLESKEIAIKQKNNRKKEIKEVVKQVKNFVPKTQIKLPYEYVALCSLIIVFVSLLQTPTYKGNVVAFEMEPKVFITESNYEYFKNKEINEGE